MKLELKWEFCPSPLLSSATLRHLHHFIATGQIYEDEKDIILDKTDLYKIPTLERFNQES